MTTLADKSLLSGGDNKPPMLEKHLYDSWKSRMELYMMNRPHGRMILASVEKGPLVWPSITVDGVTRLKEYTELTPAEAIQADCDIKAINIILQGLPTEIYALVSQHRVFLLHGTTEDDFMLECRLKSNTTEDVISIGSFMEVLVLNHYVLVRKLFWHICLVKCTSEIRQLAYAAVPDSLDEYLQIGEKTSHDCLMHFCNGVIELYGEEYLRRPTQTDVEKLYAFHENKHGFPGMIGSIDCTKWPWAQCPQAYRAQFSRGDSGSEPFILLEAVASQDLWIWHAFFGVAGSNNDVNVLRQSPVLNDLKVGKAPEVPFVANDVTYKWGYYLTDGIYPEWAVLMKSISQPGSNDVKRIRYKQAHEAARKDVERAFGVLKKKWAIVRTPARSRSLKRITHLMYTCIILHNMIRKEKGKAISPDFYPEEQHREDDPVKCIKITIAAVQKSVHQCCWTRKIFINGDHVFYGTCDTKLNGEGLRKAYYLDPYVAIYCTSSSSVLQRKVFLQFNNIPTMKLIEPDSKRTQNTFLSEKESTFLAFITGTEMISIPLYACKIANKMWIAIERLQQGESLNVQDEKTICSGNLGSFIPSRDGENNKSKPKRVKDYSYHKEKMMMCKQAKQGVPLQAEQVEV
ncbi:ALP1-like protein isoform X1 [Tanacetum coccineum]